MFSNSFKPLPLACTLAGGGSEIMCFVNLLGLLCLLQKREDAHESVNLLHGPQDTACTVEAHSSMRFLAVQ